MLKNYSLNKLHLPLIKIIKKLTCIRKKTAWDAKCSLE